MHRIMALLLLLAPQPTSACDPQAGSTFCADGMMTKPVTVPRRDAADADTATSADPGVYVEGAVTIGAEDAGEL